MDIRLLFYIIFAIIIGFGGVGTLYKGERIVGAGVFAIGAILVFVYFGIRWFEKGALPGTAVASWPPIINTCPDYLVFYERKKKVNGIDLIEKACIDPLGVSKRPDVLSQWPNTAEAPADDKYYFSLDMSNIKTDAEKRAKICERALEAGVTWEGVTDGYTCFETGIAGGGAAGAGACASSA